MVLRKKWLHGIKTSDRGNKKKVMPEFCGKQNFKGILLFNLIRRSLEFFNSLASYARDPLIFAMQKRDDGNVKNRDDVLGFGLRRLMREITTSRVSPLLVMTISVVVAFIFSLGVVSEARAACNNGVDEENKPCGSWDCGAGGSNVTCTLSKGTLKVSGNGDMTDYIHTIYQPWGSIKTSIENIVIEEGVTKIGDRAFQNLTNVKKVSLPNTLTSIGVASFMDMTGLTGSLIVPSNVTSLGFSAFRTSGITSLTLPDSLKNVGGSAFRSMLGLQELIIPDTLVIDENWDAQAFMYFHAPIRCQGDVEKCKLALKERTRVPLGSCTDFNNCFPGNITPANESQCNTSASHYFTGTTCERRPTDGSDIVCDYETKGYVKYKNYCASPETSYAKKHYTPAEAAYWLNEDNNTVTLTFKK